MLRKLIRDYIPIIFCVFLSFTQLKVLLPFINSLVIMVLGLIISLLFYRDYYKQAYIRWILVYSLVLVVNYLFGDYYFKLFTNVAEEICVLLLPAAFSYYIISRKKYIVATVLVYAFFSLIIYSAIASAIVVTIFPDAIRTTIFLSNTEETETLKLYYGMGLVTYRFCHALPIIIPALIYAFLRSKKGILFKTMALITFVSLLLIVYLSNATTALLLTLLAIVASLLVSERSTQTSLLRLAIVTVVLIPFIINSDLLINLLESVGSMFTNNPNSYVERLEDIRTIGETGKVTGDLGGRMDKYSISMTILEGNIFIGSNKQTGEHSAILDRLACLGLIGWIPYIVYIIKNTIKQTKLLTKNVVTYYIIGASAALLMLLSKNMSGWDTWFMYFCLLPVLLWMTSLGPYEVKQLKK